MCSVQLEGTHKEDAPYLAQGSSTLELSESYESPPWLFPCVSLMGSTTGRITSFKILSREIHLCVLVFCLCDGGLLNITVCKYFILSGKYVDL